MSALAMVLALLAAGLHVYIWLLESFWWTGRARGVFGTSAEQAEATRELAFNQGFYNLFLAVITFVGVGFVASGAQAVGSALVLAGTGSMLAAALTLAVSATNRLRAALLQGLPPLLAVGTILATLLG